MSNVECWPTVSPPWPTMRTPSTSRSIQLIPTASPSALPGVSTVACCICLSTFSGSTSVPSAALPSPRWKRAQAIRSPAFDEMPPAGLPLRAIAHGRATVIEPSACWLWPAAKRRVMISLGKK